MILLERDDFLAKTNYILTREMGRGDEVSLNKMVTKLMLGEAGDLELNPTGWVVD